ncbi:hypothetical protein QMM95_17980, partial [Leptospira santarosai]|uniref:hypothetical protein n=1 Tax=Leptospira santarosai TaxID=28183 RepID=UPI0024AF986D
MVSDIPVKMSSSYHFTFLSSGPVFRSLLTTFGVDSAPDISVLRLKKEVFFYIFEIENTSLLETLITTS